MMHDQKHHVISKNCNDD